MNATEAREKAKLVNETFTDCQLKVVMAYIEEAAKKGEFDYACYESLTDLTQLRLEGEGYKVEYKQGGMNEYYYKISW